MSLPHGRSDEFTLPKKRGISKNVVMLVAVLSVLLFSGSVIASNMYRTSVMDSQRVDGIPEKFMKALIDDSDWESLVTPDTDLAKSIFPPLKGDLETAELLGMDMSYKMGTPEYKLKCVISENIVSEDPEGCPQEAVVPFSVSYSFSPNVDLEKKDISFSVSGVMKLTRPFYKKDELVNPTRKADKIGPWTVTSLTIDKSTYPSLDSSSCLSKVDTFVALSDSARIQGRPYAPCTIASGNIVADSDVNFDLIGSEFPVMNEFHVDMVSSTASGVENNNVANGEFIFPYQQFVFPTKEGNYVFTFFLTEEPGSVTTFVLASVTVNPIEEVER